MLPEPHQEGIIALFVLAEEPIHLDFITVGIEPPEIILEFSLSLKLDVPAQNVVRMRCVKAGLGPCPCEGISQVNHLLNGQTACQGVLGRDNTGCERQGVLKCHRERHHVGTPSIGLLKHIVRAEIDGIVWIPNLQSFVPHLKAELGHLGCALGVTLEVEEQLGVHDAPEQILGLGKRLGQPVVVFRVGWVGLRTLTPPLMSGCAIKGDIVLLSHFEMESA